MTVPVVGLQFRHAKRVAWDGTPETFTVSAIRQGTVHYKTGTGRKAKCAVDYFDKVVAEVVGQTVAERPKGGPKLTKTAARALVRRAELAGQAAADKAVPTPMVVQQHAHPLDDSSPVTQAWYVSEGVCGFAWATIRPATGSLVSYLKSVGKGHRGYGGGWEVGCYAQDPTRQYLTQSLTRNEAYARAYAQVLQDAGYTAYAGSRID